jgi:hypothetical protein
MTALASRLTAGLLPAGMLLLAACGGGVTEPTDDLARARARWARRGPTDYTLTIYRSCECLPEMSGPVTVTVRRGAVVAQQYERTGAPVAGAYAPNFPSVEGLFARIEAGLREIPRPREIRYHPTLGYPTRFVFGDPAVDAPVTEVTRFQPE